MASGISSSSTLDEIKAAYLDNATYDEESDAAKARAFIVACRALLLKLPKRARHGGSEEVELTPNEIRGQLEAAKRWLTVNADGTAGSASRVRHISVEEFRD